MRVDDSRVPAAVTCVSGGACNEAFFQARVTLGHLFSCVTLFFIICFKFKHLHLTLSCEFGLEWPLLWALIWRMESTKCVWNIGIDIFFLVLMMLTKIL